MPKPECPYCELLIFPDGEVFHEINCPSQLKNKEANNANNDVSVQRKGRVMLASERS